MRTTIVFAAAAFAVTTLAFAESVAPPVATVEVLRSAYTTAGQPIAVESAPELIVSHTTIAPGAKLPVHKHRHQRYVHVLSGTLTVAQIFCQADNPKSRVYTGWCREVEARTYKAGDFIVEMRDMWHTGRNAGTEPVELLVIDQVPQGTKSNVTLQTEEP
jgi:quercetin dioxygenase-like cupin family protein